MRPPRLAGLTATIVAVTAAGALAADIPRVRLAEGRHAINTLRRPVYSAEGAPALAIGDFQSAYDRKAAIVRDGKGKRRFGLAPDIDLGALLSEALRTEAVAMGFRPGGSAADGWTVSGTLRTIHTTSRRASAWGGPMLFWGFMEVEVRIARGQGTSETRLVRIHHYCDGLWFSAKATEVPMARMLLEGAQELLARLNRDVFRAAPSPAIEASVAAVVADGVKRHEADIWAIGLAGVPQAVPAFQKLIPTDRWGAQRALLIQALGVIGSPESVNWLVDRFGAEVDDEDCQWAVLKALDYIGTEPAIASIRSLGSRQTYDSCRRLAATILE